MKSATETTYEYWLNKALKREEANEVKEVVQEKVPEHICAVCLAIMVEPCKFPSCNHHYYCIQCTRKMIKSKKKVECPLDRISLKDECYATNIDEAMQDKIQTMYPAEFQKHQELLAREKQLVGDYYQFLIQIEVTYQSLEEKMKNRRIIDDDEEPSIHQWTIKVRLADAKKRKFQNYILQGIYCNAWPFKKVDLSTKEELVCQITGWKELQMPMQIQFALNSGNSHPVKMMLDLQVPELGQPSETIIQHHRLDFKADEAYRKFNREIWR